MPHFVQRLKLSWNYLRDHCHWLLLRRFSCPFCKKIGNFLLYSLLIIAILISVLLCFALDNSPQTVILQGMNRDDIQRAKQLLHVSPEEHDNLKTVRLNQKDLNIAASYLLSHFVENTLQIQFEADKLLFQIAVFVPNNPWGRYLDFHFCLKQNGDAIYLKSVKIGEISIPDPAANLLLPFIVHHTALDKYRLAISEYVKNVRINQSDVEISYLGSIIDTARQLAIQKHKEYPHLHVYQQLINEIVMQHDPAWRLSLAELFQPLFLSAYQNSSADTAIQENRAVIIAVASYIYKNELRRYLPLGLIYSREYQVYAYKRVDIPQHFIAAALITAVDSSLLSLQMGLDKEVGDAQKGSGFSFIDISSDRAGIRFGQAAIASPASARRVQQIMAQTRDYTAIIPDIEGLPEHMDEASFKEKFQNTESLTYRNMIYLIDSRIAALPLYK